MSTAQSAGTDTGFSRGSLAFALVAWVFTLVFVALSFGFSPRARILPQLIGIPLLLVTTLSLVREARVVILHRVASAGSRPAGEDAAEEASLRRRVEAFAWVGGAALSVILLGFVIGSTLFLVLFLRIYGRERWLVTILMPLALIGVVEVGFVEFFGYSVLPGYLPELLGYEISFSTE